MNKESVHEESFTSLVTSLKDDLVRLIDAEKALARHEMMGKVREIRKEVALLAGGAILAGVFLLCLVTASILALSQVMAPTAAALIVGASIGVFSIILLVTFKSRMQNFDVVPRETVASVKRDARAVQEAVR